MASKLTDYVECLICMRAPKNAHLCSGCKKVFCLDHITQYLLRIARCPHCRESLTVEKLIRVPWIGEMAEALFRREAVTDTSAIITVRILTLRGASFLLKNINLNTVTGLALKKKVEDHEGIRATNQILLFKGQQLMDAKFLKTCGIKEGESIQVVERSNGGFTIRVVECGRVHDETEADGNLGSLVMLQYLGSAGFICSNDISADMVRDLLGRIDDWFWNKYQRLVVALNKRAINEIEIWLTGSSVKGSASSNEVSVQQLDGQEFWVSGVNVRRPGHLVTLRAVKAGSPDEGSALLDSIFAGVQPGCLRPPTRERIQRTDGPIESYQISALRCQIKRLESENEQLSATNSQLETQNGVIMETMINQSIAAHTAIQRSDDSEASASASLPSTERSSVAVPARSESAKRSKSHNRSVNCEDLNNGPAVSKTGLSVGLFKPVGEHFQFGFEFQPASPNGCVQHSPPISLGRPIKFSRVQGDGNCFFRSISQAINGNQELHGTLRTCLTNWMAKNAAYLASLIADVPAYLQESGMRSSGTWATQNEIHALATALQTTIFVCSLERNSGYHWTPYIPLIRLDPEPIGEAIYLAGGNGHYDLVLDVAPI